MESELAKEEMTSALASHVIHNLPANAMKIATKLAEGLTNPTEELVGCSQVRADGCLFLSGLYVQVFVSVSLFCVVKIAPEVAQAL